MAHSSTSSSDGDQADSLNVEDDEGWEDVEPDTENVKTVSLFDDQVFDDVASMLLHCKIVHDFDFLGWQRRLSE